MTSLSALYEDLEAKISQLRPEISEMRLSNEDPFLLHRSRLLESGCKALPPQQAARLREEFDGWGPLTLLWEKPGVTEILVNGPEDIWFETKGRLQRWPDQFFSLASYRRILERLCQEASLPLSLETPSANGRWRGFRVHAIRPPIARDCTLLSLRKHPENPWSLESLRSSGWCDDRQAQFLEKMIEEKRNFLVIGPTGSGKTSVLNALLAVVSFSERVAIIEDTDEIARPPGPSFKLLTRIEAPGGLKAVDQGELVKQCLRMRPDRLVLGEIRGAEAKDFLMALSTGHGGSFGTLHAEDPAQALIRLEMLIQMGAPEWSLTSIRRLIRLGLENILVTGKNKNGERRLMGVHRLVSLEDSGFLLEPEEI